MKNLNENRLEKVNELMDKTLNTICYLSGNILISKTNFYVLNDPL